MQLVIFEIRISSGFSRHFRSKSGGGRFLPTLYFGTIRTGGGKFRPTRGPTKF